MKRIIPIQSGNTKYLGLSVPEWCVALTPSGLYIILLTGKLLLIAIVIHLIIIAVYVVVLSKLEENIFNVLLNNYRIPPILQGYYINPLPISKNDNTQLHITGEQEKCS